MDGDVSADLANWSAVALARAIRDRQVSCVEVMEASLARIEALNGHANAIVSLRHRDGLMADARERDRDLAEGRWRGALHGFPQAVKDLAPCAGFPTTMGSPLHADAVAARDGIMAARMRAAGAIFVGKTNVPEFGYGSQTFNPVFGATRNVFDPSRTCGGSSGGAAVAVALGMLPVADGSDHGGSLRNPAAWSNVFGLRTTPGRVPGATDEVFLPSMTVLGPIARSVPDLALLLSVQAGPDPRVPGSLRDDPSVFLQPFDGCSLKGVRVGWLGDLGGHLPFEPGILELCEAALARMAECGAEVIAVRPDFPIETVFETWARLRSWSIAAARRADYDDPARRPYLKEEARWEVERGLAMSAVEVEEASRIRSAWFAACARLLEEVDVLALPSAQVFPFDLGTPWPREVAGRPMDTYHRWMEVAIPFTMAALPAVSVPVGFGGPGGNLPMGMQLAGPFGAERRLLEVAHAYDEATGWVGRRRSPLLDGFPAA